MSGLHSIDCIALETTYNIINTSTSLTHIKRKGEKNSMVGTYVLIGTLWFINRDNYNGVHAHQRLAMNN